VINNGDGTKTVRNVEDGYEVEVEDDWNVSKYGDSLKLSNFNDSLDNDIN